VSGDEQGDIPTLGQSFEVVTKILLRLGVEERLGLFDGEDHGASAPIGQIPEHGHHDRPANPCPLRRERGLHRIGHVDTDMGQGVVDARYLRDQGDAGDLREQLRDDLTDLVPERGEQLVLQVLDIPAAAAVCRGELILQMLLDDRVQDLAELAREEALETLAARACRSCRRHGWCAVRAARQQS